MKKYFLFDLDGTLTDPGVGITNSVAYALKSYGITVEDRTSLYSFIGPPLKDPLNAFTDFLQSRQTRRSGSTGNIREKRADGKQSL